MFPSLMNLLHLADTNLYGEIGYVPNHMYSRPLKRHELFGFIL
ncbi:Uncharacterized protein dnm_019340 [Desulfonema magnum]|uniref:Uncharacterized protein n=1 Tax=Desulfonema magnum TaxID=45655 RepID=A0A975GLM1_9BACT|nr:Uncharacterized protein dnm_019340 [Desulfonema magnum]